MKCTRKDKRCTPSLLCVVACPPPRPQTTHSATSSVGPLAEFWLHLGTARSSFAMDAKWKCALDSSCSTLSGCVSGIYPRSHLKCCLIATRFPTDPSMASSPPTCCCVVRFATKAFLPSCLIWRVSDSWQRLEKLTSLSRAAWTAWQQILQAQKPCDGFLTTYARNCSKMCAQRRPARPTSILCAVC